MRKVVAAVSVLLLPMPVAAQSVLCTQTGNQTYCTQSPGIAPPAPIQPAPIQQFDLGRAIQNRRALEAAQQPVQAPAPAAPIPQPQTREQALEASVGRLIVAGDCPGALKTALEGGAIELATHVRAYCSKP